MYIPKLQNNYANSPWGNCFQKPGIANFINIIDLYILV